MTFEEKAATGVKSKFDGIARRKSLELLNEGMNAKTISREFLKYVKQEPIQLYFPIAAMPTDLCRVSPFFPDNRRDMKERRKEFIDQMVITKSSWGDLKFTGPRLSTYDEDALLAILALLNQLTFDKELKRKGAPVYSYTGPALPVLKLMGINRPSSKEYHRLLNSLRLLSASVLELTISGKEKKRKWLITNILSMGFWDEEIGMVRIAVNPYFYEVFQQKNVTFIDVWERSKIKSPLAKCLYRFMKSHRANEWSGHLMTLAATLNLNLEKQPWIIRKDIKRGIRELVKVDFLEKESGFKGRDKSIVTLLRNPIKAKVGKKSIERKTHADNPKLLIDFIAQAKGLIKKPKLDKNQEIERQKRVLKEMIASPDPEAYYKKYLEDRRAKTNEK